MELDTLAPLVANHPVALWLCGMAVAALLGGAALQGLRALRHQRSPLRRMLHPVTAPALMVLAMATAALALLAGAAVLAQLAESGQSTGYWGRLDEAIAQQLRTHADLAALQWFAALTHLGDVWVLTAVALLVAAALWWRQRRALAVGWVVAMAGNGLLTKILKDMFARVRPEHVHGAAQAQGYSFPSGHSSASMVAYAMLAYLAVRLLPRPWHLPAVCVAGALVFTTGYSRVVLHVHYLSDVLAGWLLGGTWMVCTVLIMDSMARWRGAPPALSHQ
jgi:membrane-associated phospholipid phosphatase